MHPTKENQDEESTFIDMKKKKGKILLSACVSYS